AAAATDRLREIIGVLEEDPDGGGRTDPAAGTAGTADAADVADAGIDGIDGPGGSGGVCAGSPGRSGGVAAERLEPPSGAVTGAGGRAAVHEAIADLVARARASGVAVSLTLERGAHDPDPDPDGGGGGGVSPMAGLAAYRVVQEAVTNAARHAAGARVRVRVSTDRGLSVTVTNGAPRGPRPRPPQVASPSGGTGLTGLAERVRVAGGRLRAGPDGHGGFRVHAELPAAGVRASASPQVGGEDPDGVGDPVGESARQLAVQRRRVRRGLVAAVGVPAGLLAGLAAVMGGYHVFMMTNSVLAPADFAALHVGDGQARVEAVLPARQVPGGRVRRRAPEPAGARCRYYRPDAGVLEVGAVYRLCLAGGRLVAKDVLEAPPPGGARDRPR
ncbi:sensor histidine kinase, partial [Actinomadura parmotrematis]|nr:hypothetical protein [Actinomadura parmotrematis]